MNLDFKPANKNIDMILIG
jgi:hypothetical protein